MSISNCRQLMKDGRWLVPPSERPANWQNVPIREPIKVVTAGMLPDIMRCLCGKPLHHLGSCLARLAKSRVAEAKARQVFRDLFQSIKESGKWFGADGDMLLTAKVLVMGMMTRRASQIARVLNAPPDKVAIIAVRCRSEGLWVDKGGVVLGELEQHGDLEFWLNVMAAHGEIHRNHKGEFW